jgi:hypothetical protein
MCAAALLRYVQASHVTIPDLGAQCLFFTCCCHMFDCSSRVRLRAAIACFMLPFYLLHFAWTQQLFSLRFFFRV